jgi:hypothetical protein
MAGGKPHGSNPRFRHEADGRAQILDRAERIEERHARQASRRLAARVEPAAIEAAREYAVANGYDRDDRRAVGLVLAGMAIAAASSDAALAEILVGYLAEFPGARASVEGWARAISAAAARG